MLKGDYYPDFTAEMMLKVGYQEQGVCSLLRERGGGLRMLPLSLRDAVLGVMLDGASSCQDINLGLDLAKKYGVPQTMNTFIAEKYKEAMAAYGASTAYRLRFVVLKALVSGCHRVLTSFDRRARFFFCCFLFFSPGNDSGSSIPCRLVEDASSCRLADDAPLAVQRHPGNREAPASHGKGFERWSYTTEVHDGSYTVVHTGYANPWLTAPYTDHAGEGELTALRRRVAELEEQLAKKA